MEEEKTKTLNDYMASSLETLKHLKKKRKKRIKMSRMAILPTAERRLPDTAAFFSKKTTS